MAISTYTKQNNFISKSSAIHNGKYDYSSVVYKLSTSKVTIICPIHGEFQQEPYPHSIGKGCGECSGNVRLTTSKFISVSEKIHKNKYDYSLSSYKSAHSPITIICPVHGLFEMTASNHMNGGHGCKICADINLVGLYRPETIDSWGDIDGYFYIVELSNGDETFLKCGITKTMDRFRQYKPYVVSNTVELTPMLLKDAFAKEQQTLLDVHSYMPLHKFGGHTECFI